MIHVFMTTLVERMQSVQLDLIYQHAHALKITRAIHILSAYPMNALLMMIVP